METAMHPSCGPNSAGAGFLGSRPVRSAFAAAALLILGGYGAFIACHFAAGYGGSDSSGYMNSARLLTQGNWTQPMALFPELGEDPYGYCAPLGFMPQGTTGRMAPTYPVGLPLLLAPSALVAGWYWGPAALYTASALLTVVLCYFSCREIGVGRPWAAVAAASLACSPLFIWSSEQIMSDAPAATWCVVAFYAALRGRRSAFAAACCGAAFVLAVMIRPSDFFLLPALCVVLWDWRKLLSAFVGGLPLAVWYGWYNQTLWERPWNTGYGALYTLLDRAHVQPTLAHYAQWLPHLLPLGLLGLAGLCFLPWRANARVFLGLLLWFAATAGLYLFYPFTRQTWWYMRFLLPVFPALAILGAAVLQRIAAWKDRQGRPLIAVATAAVVLLVSVGLSVRDWNALGVCNVRLHNNSFLELADWVQEHTPDTAIISTLQASGTMIFNQRVIMRWDVIPRDKWESIVAAVRQSGRPLYFIDVEHHAKEALGSKTPGAWRKIAAVRSFGIWQLGFEDDQLQAVDGAEDGPARREVPSLVPVDRNVVRAAQASTE